MLFWAAYRQDLGHIRVTVQQLFAAAAHHHIKRGLGKLLLQEAQRRREQERVAEVAKLDQEDFHSANAPRWNHTPAAPHRKNLVPAALLT